MISILENSYEKFQSEAVEISTVEMLELVIEIETIMFWKRTAGNKRFIQVCDEVKYESIAEEWEGRLKAVKDVIKKSEKFNRDEFRNVFEKIARIEKKIKLRKPK